MEALGQVFISYSHDNVEHVQMVLSLSNKLRSEGIDCVLDQYEVSPSEGWPRWMDRKIRDAQYVIMICTEPYYRRVMGEEEAGKGKGVKWEGNLIFQHLYHADTVNTKFIPVIISSSDSKYIPTPLQGATHYCLEMEDGYDNLYWRLRGKPKIGKPPLGKLRALPVKPVKTNPIMYLTSPINIELWDKAKWLAIFVACFPDQPPSLGFVFENELAARKIFSGWQERYGKNDEYEELRISIIEGEIIGEEPGYSIHIGADPDSAIERFKDAGFEYSEDLIMMISRVHRMHPPPESRNLEMFKQAYRKYKSYNLIPCVASPDKARIKPIYELGVFKGRVIFRKADDIGKHDIDYLAIKPYEER